MPISHRSPLGSTTAIGLLVLQAVGVPSDARAAKVEFIHDFKGGTDGSNPSSGLVVGPDGAVYGSTANTVYRLAKGKTGKWIVTPVYAGALVGLAGSSTALYGLTAGADCAPFGRPCGAVSMLSPPAKGKTAWTLSTIYTFLGGGDGAFPSGINVAPDGSIVGTTSSGGGSLACGSDGGVGTGCGTVFRVAYANGKWTESLLHAYQGGRDGELPLAPPSFDAAGNVFVTTEQGGSKVAPDSCSGLGSMDIVYIFDQAFGVLADLECTQKNLAYMESEAYAIQAPKAGVSTGGGLQPTKLPQDSAIIVTGLGGGHPTECPEFDNGGCGAVALYTQPASGATPWKLSILHRFSGTDGALPAGALTALGTNTLYGVATTYGDKCTNGGYGFGGCGTIWKLVQGAKGWGWGGLVYKFPGGARGTNPVPYLLSHKGMLLGTTTYGGSTARGNPGCGTIFALTP